MRVKLLENNAVVPTRATDGAAGYDLTATSINIQNEYTEYGTGIAVAIPKGFVGLLIPRSSVTKKDLMLKNSVGVIDEDYRGEIKVRFMEVDGKANRYIPGERVAQLVIVPYYSDNVEVVLDLDATYRGVDGFGSTGV